MLAWLDSPYRKWVVLIHGDDMKLKCNFETMKAGDLHPNLVPGQKLFLTSRAFFRKRANDFHFYSALYRLTRRFRDRDSFDRTDIVAIREADEFISSAKASSMGSRKPQNDAEIEFAKFHNQMVHYGFALAIDQHRDVDVAKKVRYLCTYLFFKNMGDIELPRPYWPLAYFDPDRLLRRLRPSQFAVKTNKQCLGVGTFDLPPWHIHRGAGLLQKFGIDVIDSFTGETMKEEEIAIGGKKGTPLDQDLKVRIVAMARNEPNATQRQIAKKLGTSQATVSNVLKEAISP